ncbi:MAG: flavoprotein [Candidatus Omnitrophota bacterium]
MRKKTVLIGITGSIAAYKAAEVISMLRKRNLEIIVLMTDEAQKFITPLTFQTLTRNPVYTDLFKVLEQCSSVHVSLADRADLIVVVPATANIIAKAANGFCDDLLSCVLLSTTAPVLFCPAMHENMYKNKAVQLNISKLKSHGYQFIGPVRGSLACGYYGIGHLAKVEDIVKKADTLLNAKKR